MKIPTPEITKRSRLGYTFIWSATFGDVEGTGTTPEAAVERYEEVWKNGY